ncbi:MAG: efflux RND transporter permease subunit [Gammaproteobacteria bacterium]|nr:efflux RND transporter permease subunit [Gammaproteobacteria bacterium]
MKHRFRTGGLAAWSIHHPVGVTMLTLTVVILGLFSFEHLGINLLPHIISPEVRVRIIDPGVPASIMEDRVTRQLEEQLAITEDAISVDSRTSEGRSSVDLGFPYGVDINNALRDASIRLDRAKRFLPENDNPPIIYKRDPSQIPVMEIVVSSATRNPVELRSWADYSFSKWFLNLPGVAAVEVGGGLEREIQVIPDQEKLANIGLSLQDLADQIKQQNIDAPGGRMIAERSEITTRSAGRFRSIDELKQLPLQTAKTRDLPAETGNTDKTIRVNDVARVVDSHKDERLRIRLNKIPGVKLSIQKQPQANTVAVVEEVRHRLENLQAEDAIPDDIEVAIIDDQSVFVKHAINNAAMAAASGALLAMAVIYLFLGSLYRTLIIGSAIPIGIMVTFIIMQAMGLTFNIMTLGGLALGMGLLIDSTIVMLENITRHQSEGETSDDDAINAAIEVNSPIVASTSTNLSAILPFLFIGGMTGLLFQEMIITITSAMLASLAVALTLVPALGAKIKNVENKNIIIIKIVNILNALYRKKAGGFLNHPGITFFIFCLLFSFAVYQIIMTKRSDFPRMDEGKISMSITGDAGMQLDEMDATVEKIEDLLLQQEEVVSTFTSAGGFVFGRSEYENSNRSSIKIQLTPSDQRSLTSDQWAKRCKKKIDDMNLTGYKINLHVSGVRGLNITRGDDDVSIHIRGENLDTLRKLGDRALALLESVDGLSNLTHSYEEVKEELDVHIDRQRAAEFGVDAAVIGNALQIALDGEIISDYIEGDRDFDIRLRLPRVNSYNPNVLQNLLVDYKNNNAIRLGDIAYITRAPTASQIQRSQQQRIVEISASFDPEAEHTTVLENAMSKLDELELPAGYILYDNDTNKTLKEGQKTGFVVLLLAIFLVFVVMAVQYESLLNPLIIMISIPFAATGVALGLLVNPEMSLSMPVWLGLIMLTGIVVNNAIVLVEQIELEREKSSAIHEAIKNAAALRLRPILMTTLTTVFGMLPLAIGLGEGSEMLQPLAFVIVWGLTFSLFVSLVLVPSLYALFHHRTIKHSTTS